MMRRAIWLWLVLALGLGFGVYQLKLQVQALEQQLAKANRQILESEEAIHVLKAEWSYVNQPERIDELARKYLGLAPLLGKQYGSLAKLPQRGGAAASTPAPEGGASSGARAASPPLPLPTERPKPPTGDPVTLAREIR